MSDSVNTLFLDEPTNHLDIISREWLEESIDDFSETMIFVSHDRYFINRFATRIWQIENGHITDLSGNYDEFVRKRESERLRLQSAAAATEKKDKAPKKEKPKSGKPREKRMREVRKAIRDKEARLAEIEGLMAQNPEDYMLLSELLAEKEGLEESLLELYEEEEA